MTKKMTLVTALLIVAFMLSPVFHQVAGQQARPSTAATQNQVDPGEMLRSLQSGTPDDAGKATVTAFLRGFFLKWTDPNNAAELRKYRGEIQPIINSVSNPQGKDYLLGQFANYLYGFANKKDVYPAFRYNAVLALGELDVNQTEGASTPYPRALEALSKIYGDKGDEQDMAREAVRLGALQGLRRHVILGIANAQTRDGRIAPLLMKIAADTPYQKPSGNDSTDDDNVVLLSVNPNAENTSEPQRTVELHDWFRRTAIETLGHMSNASAPTQIEIINILLTRIQDDVESPSIRYQSAYSLSRFNKTIEASSDDLLKRTTQALLTLGLVVHDDGIQTMMEEQSTQQTVGSMSTTAGMGSPGGMGGMTPDMGMGAGGMGTGGMGTGGMTSSAGQTQADQINHSLIQIKDGLSSICACIQGPDYRSGGLMNSDAVKNTPYHQVLLELNKTMTECVKFLDEGDPEAAKRAKEAQQRTSSSMGMGMGMSPGMSDSGTTAATPVKNQPKVSMKEIEDRLRIVKRDVENLQSIMRSLEAGLTAAR